MTTTHGFRFKALVLQLAVQEPEVLMQLLIGPDGDAKLRELWREAGAAFPADQRQDGTDLRVDVALIGERVLLAIATPPPPRASNELIAFGQHIDAGQRVVRTFFHERAAAGPPVLAEISGRERRSYGPVDAPFADAIAEVIAGARPWITSMQLPVRGPG